MTTSLIIRAMRFAAHKHRTQRRDDDISPYINHPIEVMHILGVEAGIDDPAVLAAALLHDTIEDTETSIDELRDAFGDEITDIVVEVTDDQSLPRAERYALQLEKAAHYSPKAKLVRLADKIANLRDVMMAPPASWSAERIGDYHTQTTRMGAALRGTHDLLDKLLEEAHKQKLD